MKFLWKCVFFSNFTLILERQSLDFIIFGRNSCGDVLIIDPILSVLNFVLQYIGRFSLKTAKMLPKSHPFKIMKIAILAKSTRKDKIVAACWEGNQNKRIFREVEIKVIFGIRLKSFCTFLYGIYVYLFAVERSPLKTKVLV